MTGPSALQVSAVALPLAGALGVMAWRLREAKRPVSLRSIMLPPLMMSTGLAMFVVPRFRVPALWAVAAFAIGALVFAYPLLRSTRLERGERDVRLRRSKAFILVLAALAAVRIVLRDYVDDIVSPEQTAALFFLLAYGMILRWRLAMFRQFRALHR